MDIEVYKKATEILQRKNACEELLDVMEHSTFNATRVKNALAKFAEYYGIDFALYVQECLKKEQEAFDALQCCSCDKEPEEDEEDGGTTERD